MKRLIYLSMTLAMALNVMAAPARQSCIITADSALLAPLHHPYTATKTDWIKAGRIFFNITRACPGGPSDLKSRALLYSYIDGSLSLDYDRLCAIWTKREGSGGEELSGDGCATEEKFHDLRAYLDQIIDPSRDADQIGIILKHGNGLAISKLGPVVKGRVLEMAGAPQPFAPFHDPQTEALEALGYWLVPGETRFTTDEKAQFTAVLLHALPAADTVAGGRETALTRGVLEALSKSAQTDVAQTLRRWAQLNQTSHSYKTSLAAQARSSALAVEKAAQQDR